MAKEKICIDSCVFFHMMRYNDIYEKEGIKKLLETIRLDEKRYYDSIKNFESFMQPFIDSHEKKAGKKLPFEKKMALVSGIMKNKNLNIPIEVKEMYEKVHLEYAKANSFANVGRLYFKYLQKGVDFYLTPTTQAEIAFHRQESINRANFSIIQRKPGKEIFEADSIDRLARRCSMIQFKSERERDYIIKLSEVFRGKRVVKGLEHLEPAMANDINQIGLYGDSLIMAESALAGLPLITQNSKDFIIDKGQMFDKKNQIVPKRRIIINTIIQELGLSGNALPYSVEEFLSNTDDMMGLEKVLVMDDETFDAIFKKKLPNTQNDEQEQKSSLIREALKRLVLEDEERQRRKNASEREKANEYGDDEGMCL